MEGAQGEKLVGAKMQARNVSMECEERSAELGIICFRCLLLMS